MFISDYAEKSCVYEYPTTSTSSTPTHSSQHQQESTTSNSGKSEENWSITLLVTSNGFVVLAIVLAVMYRIHYKTASNISNKEVTQKSTVAGDNNVVVCTKSQEESACLYDENGNSLLKGKFCVMRFLLFEGKFQIPVTSVCSHSSLSPMRHSLEAFYLSKSIL